MKTSHLKKKNVQKKWYVIDAKGKILGKVATEAAKILIGKHKPEFSPHLDSGDAVVVINAKDVVVSGKKMKQKTYTSYSGYPGGLKKTTLETLMKKDPAEVIEHAIKGMLPKNKLGKEMFKKLRVYSTEKHLQKAQNPQAYQASAS